MIDRNTFFLVVAALVLCCGREGYSQFAPEYWPKSGIEVNTLGVSKGLVGDHRFRGFARGIQFGDFDGDRTQEIAVIPQTGVFFLDPQTLKLKSSLEFEKPDGETIWFDLKPYLITTSDNFQIVMRGTGFGDVGLLDSKGNELWKFQPNPRVHPHEMVVDDSVSGEPRFYVCDHGILYRLDVGGNVVWKVNEKIEERSEYITIVKSASDREVRFATANHRMSEMSVWNSSGTRERQIELPFSPNGLTYASSGDVSGYVIKSSRRQLAFVDDAGNHRFTHSYGNVTVRHGPTAVLVRLEPGKPPYLAVRLLSGSATGKSVLTLLSLDGVCVYQEFMEDGPGIGVVPVNGEQRDKLLVGDGMKLWAYEVQQETKTQVP